MPSSLIDRLSRHRHPDPAALGQPTPSLVRVLGAIPDPRRVRGRRHRLGFVLAVTVVAVLCGARSTAAVAQWAREAAEETLTELGAGYCRRTGRQRIPVACTIARVLARIDGDALDEAVGRWLAALSADPVEPDAPRAVAVDGKTLRGAKNQAGEQPHLLAAADHDGTVLAQRQVEGKSNEITAFAPLLAAVDLAGAVVTADALHTQRAHARFLHARGAHYLFIVKGNQPGLLAELLDYPWDRAPVRHAETTRARGRTETRTLKILLPAGETRARFPHARQILRIERAVTGRRGTADTTTVQAYAVTSLGPLDADAPDLARYLRGHWGIEALHHIRDVTYAEDAGRARTGGTPRVMATVRNTSISLLKLAGWNNIAAANRHMAAHHAEALALLHPTT